MNWKEIVQDLGSKAGNPLARLTQDLNLEFNSNKILDSIRFGLTESENPQISAADSNFLKDQILNPPPIRLQKMIVNMSLKEIAKQKFMEDVINNGNDVKTELLKWRFLIVDDHTTKIVSAVTSFSELSEYGIYDIQNIRGFREAHPTNDAIYFITPTDKNISGNFLKIYTYKLDCTYVLISKFIRTFIKFQIF